MASKGEKRTPLRGRLPGLREYTDILVKAALAEDVGGGDVTTAAVVPRGTRGKARLVAKEDLVVAGLFVARMVFKSLDSRVVFKALVKDGASVKKGRTIATVSGRLGAILAAERVALNFLQRLSGIATLTARFVKRAGGRVTILDTRKTTPCMRMLERYAVRAGGAWNHRFGLFDGVLIKDNHIAVAGSVEEALKRVDRRYVQGTVREVEVSTLKQVREALKGGADIIMLDNMSVDKVKKARKLIGDSALVEVSGGITLENIKRYAATGVDFISVGALTHSAGAVDISMEVAGNERRKRG